MADELVEIVVTAPDAELLARLAHKLVDRRLCAAAHIVTDVQSIYRWRDVVTHTTEARAWLRCPRDAVDAVAALVRAEHPHDVPSIIACPIVAGDPQYLAWITSQSTGPA